MLENGQERQSVLDVFTAFFNSIHMAVSQPVSQSESFIKQHAVTKDKRQMILDRFFSAIFAQVFNFVFVFSLLGCIKCINCRLLRSTIPAFVGLSFTRRLFRAKTAERIDDPFGAKTPGNPRIIVLWGPHILHPTERGKTARCGLCQITLATID